MDEKVKFAIQEAAVAAFNEERSIYGAAYEAAIHGGLDTSDPQVALEVERILFFAVKSIT